MGYTSTLKTETVRENDASFVSGMPGAWQYHAPSAFKKPMVSIGLRRMNFCGGMIRIGSAEPICLDGQ